MSSGRSSRLPETESRSSGQKQRPVTPGPSAVGMPSSPRTHLCQNLLVLPDWITCSLGRECLGAGARLGHVTVDKLPSTRAARRQCPGSHPSPPECRTRAFWTPATQTAGGVRGVPCCGGGGTDTGAQALGAVRTSAPVSSGRGREGDPRAEQPGLRWGHSCPCLGILFRLQEEPGGPGQGGLWDSCSQRGALGEC